MKILSCITGASGVIYGKRVAEELSKREEVHLSLVISDTAKSIIEIELDDPLDKIEGLADETFEVTEITAPPSSGSSGYDVVLIVPCSLSSLSKIANGVADNLITRAATVALKEGKRLIVVPRETPLSTIHLDNMLRLSKEGTTILPACPAFYHEPSDIDELVDFIVGKILDNIGIPNDLYDRWD